MEVEVVYTVQFKAKIKITPEMSDRDIMEAAGDIDIPEGGINDSEYKEDSFEVLSVKNGDEILYESEEV